MITPSFLQMAAQSDRTHPLKRFGLLILFYLALGLFGLVLTFLFYVVKLQVVSTSWLYIALLCLVCFIAAVEVFTIRWRISGSQLTFTATVDRVSLILERVSLSLILLVIVLRLSIAVIASH